MNETNHFPESIVSRIVAAFKTHDDPARLIDNPAQHTWLRLRLDELDHMLDMLPEDAKWAAPDLALRPELVLAMRFLRDRLPTLPQTPEIVRLQRIVDGFYVIYPNLESAR